MSFKKEMETTTNKSVYRKARKNHLENVGEISCARCPYHGVENADGQKRISKPKSKDRR